MANTRARHFESADPRVCVYCKALTSDGVCVERMGAQTATRLTTLQFLHQLAKSSHTPILSILICSFTPPGFFSPFPFSWTFLPSSCYFLPLFCSFSPYFSWTFPRYLIIFSFFLVLFFSALPFLTFFLVIFSPFLVIFRSAFLFSCHFLSFFLASMFFSS